MDRMSGSNDAFPNGHVFADSQPYNAYDNLFANGVDSHHLNDASWGVNASDFSNQSRGPPSMPSWQQGANNHLSPPSGHTGYSGAGSPYGRSLNHSPGPFAQNSYPGYGVPQNFQYRQPQYDPALVDTSNHGQNFGMGSASSNSQAQQSGTIAPQALEHETRPATINANPYLSGGYGGNNNIPPVRHAMPPQHVAPSKRANQNALLSTIPKGSAAGMFQIISFETLAQATNSERMGNFVNIGKEALEWDSHHSAIPTYTPRRSRNEYRLLAGDNPVLMAKLGKKSRKAKALNDTPHPVKPSLPTKSSLPIPGIKYDGQTSSEEDDSSEDDDDSAYSDEVDYSDSPLPPKRPETMKGAVEYDTIKALWHSKRKALNGDAIRQSLGDFWKVVQVIRDRWKADTAAVTEAEEKKQSGELPLLKSRVKDQRDMIEAAFKTALKHGHRGIVELLAENVPLIFLCYQFLLDRFKDDDVNGGLSRAILETMSNFTTLTDSKMEKTHMIKVLPRYQKKGDAKTSYWVKKILANSETASKNVATKSTTPADQKKATTTSPEAKQEPAAVKPNTAEPVVGVKRAASTAAEGTAAKKAATTATKVNSSSTTAKVSEPVKTPASPRQSSKSTTAAAPVPAAKKTVVPKSSGFFSSLQSAAKKPGTSNADKAAATKPAASKPATNTASTTSTQAKPAFSFAETMANLAKPKEEKPAPKPEKETPKETPEQLAKRLRKEERRKLNVRFKQDDELVQIRTFVHDPEEETHNDASQVRDVSDVGGEGRMFKQQHQMMDLDDDDEVSEEVQVLIDFKTPSLVDFNVVAKEERSRNYAPYGGGELQPKSAERAVREQAESNTLLVFYSDESQIPPNPREPTDSQNDDNGSSVEYFGQPEEKYLSRARARKTGRMLHQTSAFIQAPNSTLHSGSMQANGQNTTLSNPDIQSILDKLRQSTTFAQQPSTAAYIQPFMGAPTAPTLQSQAPAPAPPVPNGNIDLAAILFTLQNNNAQHQQQQQQSTPSAPPMAGFTGQATQTQNYGASVEPSNVDIDGIKAKNPFYKTKVCRFWQQGRCQKGDACSYLHE